VGLLRKTDRTDQENRHAESGVPATEHENLT